VPDTSFGVRVGGVLSGVGEAVDGAGGVGEETVRCLWGREKAKQGRGGVRRARGAGPEGGVVKLRPVVVENGGGGGVTKGGGRERLGTVGGGGGMGGGA